MCHIFLFLDLKGRGEGRGPQRFSVIAVANFWEYSSNCKVFFLKAFCFSKIKLLSIPGIKYGLCKFRTYKKACVSSFAAMIWTTGFKRYSTNSTIFSGFSSPTSAVLVSSANPVSSCNLFSLPHLFKIYNDTYLRQFSPGDLLFLQLENIHSHQKESQYSLLSIRQFEYDSSTKGCDCRQPSGVWTHKRLFVRVYAQKRHGDMEVCAIQRHLIVFGFLGVFRGCRKHLIRELSSREAALRWQTSAPARTDGE